MSERKSTIPKTNVRNQLDIFRWDIRDSVFDQMDADLYWSVREMIGDEVNRATPESRNGLIVCIADIMKLL